MGIKLNMENIPHVFLFPHDGFDRNTIVYKYRQPNEYAFKSLLMNQVYFAQASAFNDPFEKKDFGDLDVDIKGAKEVLDQIRADSTGDILDRITRAINYTIENCGIFCLCKTPDNLHMWSFYGSDEKGCGLGGFAIGYKLESLLRNLKPSVSGNDKHTPRWKYVYNVLYENTPRTITYINMLNGNHKELGLEQQSIFAHKSTFFQNEEEIRIVVEQSQHKEYTGHGLYDHDPDDIAEIVFGEHFTADNEAVIRRVLEGRNVKFKRAKRSPKRYTIQIVDA